jgi:Cu(I)/Ag(I) efflux system protein CusF
MNRISGLLLAGALAAGLANPVLAQQPPPAAEASAPASAPGNAAAPTEGEVRRVDKANGKITVRHEEIKNLEMPAMTMVFQVKDPAMLDKVKAGDKVRFTADKVNGAFTLTTIELVP